MSNLNFSVIVTDIANELIKKHKTASVAESLTGGLVASEIVRAAGSSQWFCEGAVTYSDTAKSRRLNIPSDLIKSNTAVSRVVAEYMAIGMRDTSCADISVATTGLAGPGLDSLGRPAGLVYIGGACSKGVVSYELHLSGDRTTVREKAAYSALLLLDKLAHLD